MIRLRSAAVWSMLALVLIVPVFAAALSPLLEWRSPVYIVAGLAGVFGLSLLLLQPMLAGGFLPGLSSLQRIRFHRWVGATLTVSLFIHLVGLWVTSPPDVVDALLFVSATPFSIWGVIAMWSVLATVLLVLYRRKLRLSSRVWRLIHQCLAVVTVVGSVVHALMVEGTMEMLSKVVLCLCVVVATGCAIWHRAFK